MVIGERGFFTTSDDCALSDDQVEAETKPLRPAHPEELDGIGRRLHDTALADGQRDVAAALTYVFGDGTCPDCDTDFSVAARISADWSAVHPDVHPDVVD